MTAAITAVALSAIRPVAIRSGRQIAERMLDPNGPGFAEQLEKIRARHQTPDSPTSSKGAPKDAGL